MPFREPPRTKSSRGASPSKQYADCAQSYRKQPGRHLLARGNDGVVLACVMDWSKFARPAHKLVGLTRHGRDNHRHLVVAVDFSLNELRHVPDAIEVRDRGAAEF